MTLQTQVFPSGELKKAVVSVRDDEALIPGLKAELKTLRTKNKGGIGAKELEIHNAKSYVLTMKKILSAVTGNEWIELVEEFIDPEPEINTARFERYGRFMRQQERDDKDLLRDILAIKHRVDLDKAVLQILRRP